MADILVVDDDKHIREVVRFALSRAGHSVREASNGSEALAQAKSPVPDLIVLDIVMPEEDGLTVCKTLRKTSSVPIIFLSSRDDEIDRVLGLELGADDYITKPFSPRELVARVAAVLRRMQPTAADASSAPPAKALQHAGLSMDVARHRCTYAGQDLVLTVTEFALLQVLLTAPGRVFERAQLVELAYGDGYFITERTVDSHIRRVRRKLEVAGPDPIETIYGLGYRLRE